MKKVIIGIIAFFLAIPLFISTAFVTTKGIPYISEEDIEIYKEAAKIESRSGANIDWKYLVAIDAVRNKQDFSKVTKRKSKWIAKKFIRIIREEDSEGNVTIKYELRTPEEVMKKLSFSEEEIEGFYTYLEIGLGGSSLDNIEISDEEVEYRIPRFYQYDQRWANLPYGESTIGKGGCGTTSFAMVATGMNPPKLKNMDKNGDEILDPIEASNWSAKNGYKVYGNGTSWAYFKAAGKVIGLNVVQYDKSNYENVYKKLNNGYPVIASMLPGHFTRNGHFIVLAGVDEQGKIIVNDPASEDRSNKRWDYKSIIVPETAQFWVFDNPELVNTPLARVYKYKEIKNPDKIKDYIRRVSNGHIADEPHFSTIVKVAKENNLNPFILLAISGAEQSFATKKFGDYSVVIKNPYNVYGTWQVYHPGLEKSSQVAARTVINLSKESKVKSNNVFERIGEKYVQSPGWKDWVKICKQYFNTFSQLDN